MKRTYSQFSNNSSNQNINNKHRRLNNNQTLSIKTDKYQEIKNEIYHLRNRMLKMENDVKDLKNMIEEIQYFIGMKYKKFDNDPTYFC